MRFEFATATRIIFGRGSANEVGQAAASMGKRAFVVTGRSAERAEPLIKRLKASGVESETFSIPGEPTTTIVKQAVGSARQAGSDMVISIGGGSALDTGKAIAAMLTNTGSLEEYLEVVGLGKPITQNPVPHIAIPTTAGTGAEVTRNAVLGVPEHKVKVSMRSPLMLPSVAIVDPELTYSMPPAVTAATGLDALTQLIEAYVSNKANPLTDGICREGIKRAGRSLRAAYEDGSNGVAREDMALASLFGGLALANAKLGAVHGFAGPLGGMTEAPHGVICAALLPHVMEANIRALQQREGDSRALARYDNIAALLTGDPNASADEGLEWLQNLCSTLKTPALHEFGLEEKHYAEAVQKAQKSSSMKGNPITLTDDELMEILIKAGNPAK
ncbi:MAG: iron-containing alcohol dehydrogenase [Sedimentisphaerales bacterium]|nr:iron-containing alcohol dehydrogenase [Sedimentisphaerales bacterium]